MLDTFSNDQPAPATGESSPTLSLTSSPIKRMSEPVHLGPPRTTLSISIVPKDHGQSSFGAFPYDFSYDVTPSSLPTFSTSIYDSFKPVQPRPITVINPIITFVSPSPVAAYSAFSVLLDGVNVHSEVSNLLTSPEEDLGNITATRTNSWFYYSRLVPNYWQQLCASPGTSRLHQNMNAKRN